ncbi:hypothetical protein ACVWW1_004611 [Bradyrhizobium sp. JR3.5]
MNGLSSTLRMSTQPEQWFAWAGKSAQLHPALARRFVDRIPHGSKLWLIAGAGLSRRDLGSAPLRPKRSRVSSGSYWRSWPRRAFYWPRTALAPRDLSMRTTSLFSGSQ